MPTIPDEFVPIRANAPQAAQPDPEAPALLDTVKAAGSQWNWPYRGWRYLQNRADVTAEPDYDPFAGIAGTKYESDPGRFAYARNSVEADAIKREWDEDEEAMTVLAKSGWTGTVASIGAGLLDPTIFIPVAKVFSGAAQGAKALSLAGDVALSAGVTGAIGEGVMLATRPDYTLGDAAIGVGTDTLLGGLLGFGAGALMSRTERQALTQSLDADRADWGASLGQAQAAGAAASDTRRLELNTPAFLKRVPDATAKVSPTRRVLNSRFVSARRAVADLVETPYIFKENLEGIATTQGPALDRIAKLEEGRARVAVAQTFDELYTKYRYENSPGRIGKKITELQDMAGRDTGGKLTYEQWKAQVDYALRNGDVHEIPEVAEAAKFMRKQLLEPWRDRAIKAGLLPEDIDVKTADSYMMRAWNKEKLISRRPEARAIFSDWIGRREAEAVANGEDITPRSKAELDTLADEIIDRIVGNPDGRLPYDAPGGGPTKNTGGRGPLAGRVFLIPDNLVTDFIETDVQSTAEMYLRTMVPDVLLTERFGDVDMTDAFRKLQDEAIALQNAATSETERAAIKAEYDAAVSDLAAMRDRIRHTYGHSSDPRMRMMGRVAATAARYDMITNLGGAALSSLSDLAGIQWRHGFATTFKSAWKPMLKSLVDPELRKALGRERQKLRALGIAAETYLSTRTTGIYDVLDVYRPTSKFERATTVMADKFGLASLLTPWTDFGKFSAGMVSGAEISRAAEALAAGKASARQIRDLAEGGIDEAMASRIAKQLQAPGGSDVVDGVRMPNTALWSDAGARQAFEGAMARDVDIMIITPGAEKPLMMSKPTASLILQYKSFVVAANERLLVRSLQARDAQVLQGLASAIALGALAELCYSYIADREPPQTPQDWIKAGIQRSGVLGWYAEGNSILAKWTGGATDVFRLIGAGKVDPRYISRSPLGALLGPTANKAETTIKSSAKLIAKMLGGDVEWTANDTTNARRLIAFQNLFYIRTLLDDGEDVVNEWLGVEPKDRDANGWKSPW